MIWIRSSNQLSANSCEPFNLNSGVLTSNWWYFRSMIDGCEKLNSQIKFQLRFNRFIVKQFKVFSFDIKKVSFIWHIQDQTWLAV